MSVFFIRANIFVPCVSGVHKGGMRGVRGPSGPDEWEIDGECFHHQLVSFKQSVGKTLLFYYRWYVLSSNKFYCCYLTSFCSFSDLLFIHLIHENGLLNLQRRNHSNNKINLVPLSRLGLGPEEQVALGTWFDWIESNNGNPIRSAVLKCVRYRKFETADLIGFAQYSGRSRLLSKAEAPKMFFKIKVGPPPSPRKNISGPGVLKFLPRAGGGGGGGGSSIS